MSAYLLELKRRTASLPITPPANLTREKLQLFLEGLPEIARDRPFAMSEFEVALGMPGRLISPELLALGWVRKRRWSSTGQYHRFWQPRKG